MDKPVLWLKLAKNINLNFMNKIYFDHSATTPIDKKVLKAMKPFLSNKFGNASSLHSFGQEANQIVEESRKSIAKFLNCSSDEIIFTSGATEANNLAIMGLVPWTEKIHIITSAIEHPSVLEVCKHLEKTGHAEVSYIKPNSNGIIEIEKVKNAIQENTKLISTMYANNEIGTIQPIQEIGNLISEINANREKQILFHTDAVQAINYLNSDIQKLKVNLLSFSGHKIYGPKGIGVLFVKNKTQISPITFGGHHEKGLRSGTLNVASIVGIGKAVKLISSRNNSKISELKNYCWKEIQEKIPNAKLNGDLEKRVSNNLNISFTGVEGEALLLDLDLVGIAVSTGSACSAGTLEPSHVLTSIGLSHEDSHGSLRITFGKDNNKKQVDALIKKLILSVEKFRKMSPVSSPPFQGGG